MPILDENSLDFISLSPDQTRRIGVRLGSMLATGDVLCLCGELGAGKTTMVQGIAQGWGSSEAVTSPTFVLVNHYHRPDGAQMYHLDAYRLQDARDAEVLDLDNLMETGILVVEWPEKIQSALPVENLWLEMFWIADEQRRMMFLPHSERYQHMVEELRHQIYSV